VDFFDDVPVLKLQGFGPEKTKKTAFFGYYLHI